MSEALNPPTPPTIYTATIHGWDDDEFAPAMVLRNVIGSNLQDRIWILHLTDQKVVSVPADRFIVELIPQVTRPQVTHPQKEA